MPAYPIDDNTMTAVWEWFKRTFKKDPTKVSRKDALKLMEAHYTTLRKSRPKSKDYTTIKRFMTPEGKAKGLWSQKVNIHSQMKKISFREQKTPSGIKYARTYTSWDPKEDKTLKRNINLSNKSIQALIRMHHHTYHTLSSISTRKSRILNKKLPHANVKTNK